MEERKAKFIIIESRNCFFAKIKINFLPYILWFELVLRVTFIGRMNAIKLCLALMRKLSC